MDRRRRARNSGPGLDCKQRARRRHDPGDAELQRSSATTGSPSGENHAAFTGGPTATGTTGAQSSQIGKNSADLSQSGTAKSGDPVAGAQVTGAVADNVTVQNQNSADNPVATAGMASVVNDTVSGGNSGLKLGPQSLSSGDSMATQNGDNAIAVTQSGNATSGDAVAGAQVTGIVGSGEHTVQNQNTASCTDNPCASGLQNSDDPNVGVITRLRPRAAPVPSARRAVRVPARLGRLRRARSAMTRPRPRRQLRARRVMLCSARR